MAALKKKKQGKKKVVQRKKSPKLGDMARGVIRSAAERGMKDTVNKVKNRNKRLKKI